jgi:phage terminase Nu1 subunit (DNA packaging protein)
MPNKTEAQTVPVAALANIFNITQVRVQQLAKMGVVVKSSRGTYELWKSVKGYIKYLQDRAAGKGMGEGDGGDYEKHRTRLYAARADAQEVISAKLKRTAHDAEAVAEVMNDMVANARSRILAIPTLVAPRVADESDPAVCLEIIRDAAHEALTELTDYNPDKVVARFYKQLEAERNESPEADEAEE